ncbi:ImmA/IrrE family metallo-endopeptidase [Sutcliffiella halmapala]|uniref:ImmA/IrrE family metallo-endopeptidase n=1 Tax=Sutcliffiella halmapala TaxID=79882 RepID=UPI000994F331|nr:ImmA/IrrE family metallo-endopeptidase [Sutcliffiella halmapala]
MHLSKLLQSSISDCWEERANKVLSNFNFSNPDEIDMYQICWKYGVKIKPLDMHFFDGEINGGIKAMSFPKEKGRRGVIYLLPNLDPLEKKVILAEEFCHCYSHHISQISSNDSLIAKTEAQAKRMAAYLLMPNKFLKNAYSAAEEEAVMISDIADYFVVSEEFAHYRLRLIFDRQVDGFGMVKGKLGSIEWIY